MDIVKSSQNSVGSIDKLKKQRASREKQLDTLIDRLSESGLTEAAKNRIKSKINNITEETELLSVEIEEKESTRLDDSYIPQKMSEIKAAITDLRNFTKIDRDRILNYIERIEIPANGDIEILLQSGQVIVAKTEITAEFSDEQCVSKSGIHHVRYSLLQAYQLPPRL